MTYSIRNSSSEKKILICVKALQEERLTALWTDLSERRLTKGRRLPGFRYIKGRK